MRACFVLAFLFAAGCTQTGVYQGRLVDGLTGAPVAATPMVARCPTASRMDCQLLETTTKEDGTFTFDKLCVGEKYSITLTEGATLHLTDVAEATVQSGTTTKAPSDIKAWNLPPDMGMYVYAKGTYEPVRANADVKRAFLWESQDTVRMPATLPQVEPRVDKDQYLVLLGDRYLERMKFFPLVKSGPRKFGKTGDEELQADWYYVGMEFVSDTEYKKVEATPDKSKVQDVTVGENKVRFIKGDALPAGHYAALADMDRRMTVVTFGPEGKALGAQ